MKKIYLIIIILAGIALVGNSSASLTEKIVFEELTIDSNLLRRDVAFLSDVQPARNYLHPDVLDSIAAYIFSNFSQTADTVYYQTYLVNGIVYRNVIAQFGTQYQKKMIVGAHYDVCHELPGADDNASGIAGILALARQLKNTPLQHQIELVAYTLEEPPFFRTEHMGSAMHAKSIDRKNVLGMICLEMIGYFSVQPNSQSYPVKAMKLIYPSTGNFIAFVANTQNKHFAEKIQKFYGSRSLVKGISINAPNSLEGIDFSDHLNYWAQNIPALMVTNTAFYRNKNYHTEFDVKEKLNYTYMAWVIQGVLESVANYKE